MSGAIGPNTVVLEKYRLEGILGKGGMARVWKARELAFGSPIRAVCVKEMHQALQGDPVAHGRYRREVKALGQLDGHANLLQMLNHGIENGQNFLVTELLEGQELKQHFKETWNRVSAENYIPTDEDIGIFQGIARGIHYMHKRGVFHRDLKPQNIFVLNDGGVKIIDLGMATEIDPLRRDPAIYDGESSTDGLTQSGVISGTPLYMSPEQALGLTSGTPENVRAVGPGSDQYSLGAIMYQWATGRTPHTGGSHVAILANVLNEDFDPIASINREFPEELSTIIERMLEKDPKDRYPSIKSVDSLLQRYLDIKNTSAVETNRSVSYFLFGAAAVGIAAGVGAVTFMTGEEPKKPIPIEAHETPEIPVEKPIEKPVEKPIEKPSEVEVVQNTKVELDLNRNMESLEVYTLDDSLQKTGKPFIPKFSNGKYRLAVPDGRYLIEMGSARDAFEANGEPISRRYKLEPDEMGLLQFPGREAGEYTFFIRPTPFSYREGIKLAYGLASRPFKVRRTGRTKMRIKDPQEILNRLPTNDGDALFNIDPSNFELLSKTEYFPPGSSLEVLNQIPLTGVSPGYLADWFIPDYALSLERHVGRNGSDIVEFEDLSAKYIIVPPTIRQLRRVFDPFGTGHKGKSFDIRQPVRDIIRESLEGDIPTNFFGIEVYNGMLGRIGFDSVDYAAADGTQRSGIRFDQKQPYTVHGPEGKLPGQLDKAPVLLLGRNGSRVEFVNYHPNELKAVLFPAFQRRDSLFAH